MRLGRNIEENYRREIDMLKAIICDQSQEIERHHRDFDRWEEMAAKGVKHALGHRDLVRKLRKSETASGWLVAHLLWIVHGIHQGHAFQYDRDRPWQQCRVETCFKTVALIKALGLNLDMALGATVETEESETV